VSHYSFFEIVSVSWRFSLPRTVSCFLCRRVYQLADCLAIENKRRSSSCYSNLESFLYISFDHHFISRSSYAKNWKHQHRHDLDHHFPTSKETPAIMLMAEEDVWYIRPAVSRNLRKKLKQRIAHLMLFKCEPGRGIPSK
jgi:hypothetical protein